MLVHVVNTLAIFVDMERVLGECVQYPSHEVAKFCAVLYDDIAILPIDKIIVA